MNELPEVVDYILHGVSIERIDWLIHGHPDLAELNRRFDEFYLLPGEAL